MAVQAGPGAALIVPQPKLLLPVLVEALNGPALVGEAELLGERMLVQVPGEGPLGFAGLARQRALPD